MAVFRSPGFRDGVSLAVAPPTVNFGSVVVGSDSAAQPFTLTNTGSASAGPIGVTLSGPDASQFLIASTTCSAATLPAGGTCMVSMLMHPTTSGAKAATLTFSGSGVMAAATLSGNGVVGAPSAPTGLVATAGDSRAML